MNKNIVMTADQYHRVDGRNAYHSDIKRLTLGVPTKEENKTMQIAAQIWKEDAHKGLYVATEIPIHLVFDLMIFLSRTLLHFKEAYRLPLLYDPESPTIERIGIQGDALPIAVCADNAAIIDDIKGFAQALNDLGELTGERLRILTGILEELACY